MKTKKLAFILSAFLLLSTLIYTIYANGGKIVNIIQIPEGTITEIIDIQQQNDNPTQLQSDPDSQATIIVETKEVPEGIITIKTEMSGSHIEADINQFEQNPALITEQLQQNQDMLDGLLREAEAVKALHEDNP